MIGRMDKKILTTGIKPTGHPHIGNYIGMMRPALQEAREERHQCFYFIADYHALIDIHQALLLKELNYVVAATWLAFGLDPSKVIFFRQSDIPEITELAWVLNCVTQKGLLNRAHAYKARIENNQEMGLKDVDSNISMGLYCYPVLMAADILAFRTDLVPVGQDQTQHIEIARDIAGRFRRAFKSDILKDPEALIRQGTGTIPGLDGRKMSKSYGNTIELFVEPNKLRKLINRIVTDSSDPKEPKDPSTSDLFYLFRLFATPEEINEIHQRYLTGIGWGEVKEALYHVMNRELEEPRATYKAYIQDTTFLEETLREGAEKARGYARPVLTEVKKAIGVQAIY